MARDFVHLHGHTEYSEKDATAKIPKIVAKAKKHGMKAVAVTEHGNMFSLVKNYLACNDKEVDGTTIKYIPGSELYYTPNRDDNDDNRYHIVCLAKDNAGLVNLYRMVSDAGLHKLPGKTKDYPRTDDKHIAMFGKGVIGLSACMGGIIPKLVLEGKYDEAKAKALQFSNMFEEFYLEVQPHEMQEQLLINDALVKMSKETGIPLVITGDYHYVDKSDKKYHDILMAMGYHSPYSVYAHFCTPEEIEDYCIKHNIPLEAMDNTVKIADSVNVDPKPKDERGLMPPFPCPTGYTEETYLRELSMNGLLELIPKKGIKEAKKYIAQMLYELDIICSMGFAGYFLILWDWFDWCRKNKILMGKGRGSAAGSIVSYALNITTIDPIKNGYYFERFLNPERIEFPDVDSDIAKLDRPKAIGYLLNKYGAEYVSQIITFTKYKLKNTIKGAMSAFNLPFDEANEVTKQIPDLIDGKEATLEYIMEIADDPDKFAELGTKTLSQVTKTADVLKNLFAKYPDVYDAVSNLNGCVAGTGIHAGGVVISGKPLADNLPLISGSDTAVLPLCQIAMDDLGFFNALKIDALGLTTLSQMRTFMDLVGLPDEWFDSEEFDDIAVYDLMREGLTTDIFQMSGHGATKLLRDFKVDDFEGITNQNATNRPGPLAKNKDTGKSMADIYIEARNSGKVISMDPRIDWILAPTYGAMLFQEQIMKLGEVMAGYSLGAADIRIRKVLGKKKLKEIPFIETEFIYGKKPVTEIGADGKPHAIFQDAQGNRVDGYEQGGRPIPSNEPSPYCVGALARGYDLKFAQQIFDSMKEFAKYAFNKAHSGAYAALGYKTGWAKKYHPVEFSIACLKTHDSIEKIVATLSDCKRMGIKVLPPDINKSDVDFTIEALPNGDKAIRYGLSAIKNVGPRAVQFIMKYRPFVSFVDYFNKVHDKNIQREVNPETGKFMNNPLDKTVESSLIKAGAFDEFQENRYQLLNEYMLGLRKEKDYTALDTKKFSRKVKLEFEREIMGSYISEHPLDPLPYADIDACGDGEEVEIAGVIKTVTKKKTKGGKEFASVVMEAKDGKDVKFNVFNKVYEKYKSRLVKNEVVIIEGDVSKTYNNITANKIKKIVRNTQPQQNTAAEQFQAPVRYDPFSFDGNPVDDIMAQYGG